ncbi:MAG: hypothetical protein ACI92G_002679 [Candidatus Pelagisphaera sp.]|jgi:hypothetical protein
MTEGRGDYNGKLVGLLARRAELESEELSRATVTVGATSTAARNFDELTRAYEQSYQVTLLIGFVLRS